MQLRPQLIDPSGEGVLGYRQQGYPLSPDMNNRKEMSEQATQETTLAVHKPTRSILRPIFSPSEMIEAHNQMTEFIQGVLKEGRDFGVIPGTKGKASLLKAGAERILMGFGCMAVDEIVQVEADHNAEIKYEVVKWVDAPQPMMPGNKVDMAEKKRLTEAKTHRNFKKDDGSWIFQEKVSEAGISYGYYRYVVRTKIIRTDTGEVIGSGIGACSTAEAKYIRQPRDAENTVIKMAKKRALVDATLSTFALSERFTQDAEDIAENKAARQGQVIDTVGHDDPPQALSAKDAYWALHRERGLPVPKANADWKVTIACWQMMVPSLPDIPKTYTDEHYIQLARVLQELTPEDYPDGWKSQGEEAGS